MSIEGVDFANQRPSGPALRAAGKTFVVRYLSPNTTNNPRKLLTPSEVDEYHGAGLAICVVWETGTSRARAGYTAGQGDADLAAAVVRSLGGPAGLPIYFAIDEDTTGPAVEAYFRGVAAEIGLARTGAYGGIKPISWLFDNGRITYGWQTYAWSDGKWDPRAQAQQYRNNVSVPGCGSGYDLDRAMTGDYGQWNPDGTHGDQGVDMTTASDVWAEPLHNSVTGKDATAETFMDSINRQANNLTANQVPALADAIGELAAAVAALPTADQIAAAVAAALPSPGGAAAGGVTAATLAAAERAAADVLAPPATG